MVAARTSTSAFMSERVTSPDLTVSSVGLMMNALTTVAVLITHRSRNDSP